ncbi:BhlA/UviB family holin-like peptide [Clostridium baratii]|uniref:BhlA/UviB family holin-like peptide n=1 Tax=Clostridium baratii TaxID=1561 RepID=UPI0030CF67DC
MDELIKVAIEQGLGYALFILLLLYVLKTSGEREKKYQETIQDLTQALKGVDNVKSDVDDIKEDIKYIKERFRK